MWFAEELNSGPSRRAASCLFSCLFGWFFYFFETGFLCVALAVLELTRRPGWPQTQKSACLCLPSAGIKGMRHHCPGFLFMFVCIMFVVSELAASAEVTAVLYNPGLPARGGTWYRMDLILPQKLLHIKCETQKKNKIPQRSPTVQSDGHFSQTRFPLPLTLARVTRQNSPGQKLTVCYKPMASARRCAGQSLHTCH